MLQQFTHLSGPGIHTISELCTYTHVPVLMVAVGDWGPASIQRRRAPTEGPGDRRVTWEASGAMVQVAVAQSSQRSLFIIDFYLREFHQARNKSFPGSCLAT